MAYKDFFVQCGGTRIELGECRRCGAAKRNQSPCRRRYPRAIKLANWYPLVDIGGRLYYRRTATSVAPVAIWWPGSFNARELFRQFVADALTGEVSEGIWAKDC